MRKIFIFWIVFLVVLAAGISLAISSRATLKREEKRAEELRKAVISRPSRLPKQPVVSEAKTEAAIEAPKETTETAPAEPVPAVASSPSGEIPPLQNDIPVQINTNSLEISVPSPAKQENPASQEKPPAAGQ